MFKRKISAVVSAALLSTAPVALIVLPAAPAFASEDCAPKSGAAYCYCLYNNAFEEAQEASGSDSVSIMKRIEIAKKALKSCLNRSADDLQKGVDDVHN